MVIFHSYVKLPEGRPTFVWFKQLQRNQEWIRIDGAAHFSPVDSENESSRNFSRYPMWHIPNCWVQANHFSHWTWFTLRSAIRCLRSPNWEIVMSQPSRTTDKKTPSNQPNKSKWITGHTKSLPKHAVPFLKSTSRIHRFPYDLMALTWRSHTPGLNYTVIMANLRDAASQLQFLDG